MIEPRQDESPNECHFQSVPHDVIAEIFSHLDKSSSLALRKTCLRMCSIFNKSDEHYERLFIEEFHYLYFVFLGLSIWDKKHQWASTYKMICEREYKGLTATEQKLFMLVKRGESDQVIETLSHISKVPGEGIWSVDDNSRRPLLYWVARFGNGSLRDLCFSQIRERLRAYHAAGQTNVTYICGKSLLYHAMWLRQSLAVINPLLECSRPKNLEQHNEDGRNLLFAACYNRNIDLVARLLQKKVDPNLKDDYKVAPIHFAIRSRQSKDIVSLLIQHGAEVNMHGGFHEKPPLQMAIECKDMSMVQLLLSKNARPDRNMLDIALTRHDVELVQLLYAHGVNISREDISREDDAAIDSEFEKVRFFIKNDVIVKQIHRNDTSILFHAVCRGQLDIVEFFTEHPVEPKVSRAVFVGAGITLLMYAAYHGHINVVKYLIEVAKADMTTKISKKFCGQCPGVADMTALDIAIQEKHEEIIQ